MYEKELECAIYAAREAEKLIKEVYLTNFEVEIKEDDSPVTKADKLADNIIREILGKNFPEYGFLTEESEDNPERLKKEFIWIVDPVDGTKEFVSRNGQFTTNIALAKNGEVVVGIVNVPMFNCLYYAVKNEGAYRINPDGSKERIFVSDKKKGELRTMRSISFFKPEEKAFLDKHKDCFVDEEIEEIGAANKFAAIAEGRKDFFIRLSSGTKEWDVASGDLLVSEAGGIMVEPDGNKIKYNKVDVYNRKGYLIANSKENLFLD